MILRERARISVHPWEFADWNLPVAEVLRLLGLSDAEISRLGLEAAIPTSKLSV